jgi:hypothetical protein
MTRIEFQSTVGDGYALAKPDELPIDAVTRSLARRTGSTIGPVRLDSWSPDRHMHRYEIALLEHPMQPNGDAVSFRNIWITVYW